MSLAVDTIVPLREMRLLPVQRDIDDKHPSEWTRDEARDAAAQALSAGSAYELSCQPAAVLRVCKEVEALELDLQARDESLQAAHDEERRADRVIGDYQVELADVRGQLAAEREKSRRLERELGRRGVAVQIEHQIERRMVTITGLSQAELTARLNDQVHSHAGATDSVDLDGDKRVIDVPLEPMRKAGGR